MIFRTIFSALMAVCLANGAQAQATFQDCETCPTMVRVPGTTVTLGRNGPSRPEEGPAYEATLEPFAISVLEITQQQWLDHMEYWRQQTGRPRDPEFTRLQVLVEGCFAWDLDASPARMRQRNLLMRAWKVTADHPVGCISYQDAQAYVTWLNERTDGGYRLPTEAELEYLMRLQDLPDDPVQACQHYNGALADFDFPHDGGPCPGADTMVAASGSFLPNALGVSDLYGNLWELTHNCWTDRANAPDTHDQRQAACTGGTVTVRGASFDDPQENFRATVRQPVPSTRRQQNIGFRVVKMN